jgi:hypothetical protein
MMMCQKGQGNSDYGREREMMTERSTHTVYHWDTEISDCEFTPNHKLEWLEDVRNEV